MSNPALKPHVRLLIQARKKAKVCRENQQRKLLADELIYADAIADKLAGRYEAPQFGNFLRCGVEQFFRTCRACASVETMTYRCNIKWCPRCQWRIAAKRQELIAEWAKHITQPKHLVTTQKNFPILTRSRIAEHTDHLRKLRRHACFKSVLGGCVSVEITNEGEGWHLHAHWLLNVRWLDMEQLAQAWASLVGQSFAIVKVKDVRNADYKTEVAKYLAKGSEIASWPADQVHEFVRAIHGRRFFFAFGDLFQQGAAIRVAIRERAPHAAPCECGCSDFVFESESQAIINQLRKERR